MTLRCENASFYNFKKEIWLFNNAEIIVRRMGLPVDRATIKFGVYKLQSELLCNTEIIVRRMGLPVDCTTIKPYMKSNGSAKLPFGFFILCDSTKYIKTSCAGASFEAFCKSLRRTKNP